MVKVKKKKTPKTMRSVMRELRTRPAAQWMEMIEATCEGKTRDKVKCVVWWDFLANRSAALPPIEGFEAVTMTFGFGHNETAETIIPVLVQIGYPKRMADERGMELKHCRDNETMRRYRAKRRIKG